MKCQICGTELKPIDGSSAVFHSCEKCYKKDKRMNIELKIKLKIKDQEIELTEDEVQDLIMQLKRFDKSVDYSLLLKPYHQPSGIWQKCGSVKESIPYLDPIEGWKIT